MNKYNVLWTRKSNIWMLILVFSMFMFILPSIFAQPFQMEWGSVMSQNETWITVNMSVYFEDPIVVTGPEYAVTSQANGITTWVRNVTNTSFELRTSNENLNSVDSINVHYIVMERGSWNLPGSGIKVEANSWSTAKVGIAGAGNWNCPTRGDVITFNSAFTSNPLVIATRGSDNNANSWADTFKHDVSTYTSPVGVSSMCAGLSQSKAISPGAIVSPEIIYWIAADEGNGSLAGVEFEILWNMQDTGTSGGYWINGYTDGIPFTQVWAHSWIGAPNVIIGSQTSVAGTDGSWPVIYDTGNTVGIRMFVDEANERGHTGSESGGGWAFNHSSYIDAPANVSWNIGVLDLGWGIINSTNVSGTALIDSYKWNDNVSVICDSGNCSVLSSNWSLVNMINDEQKSINFSCSNQSVGAFWAIFNVSSLNDTDISIDQINVSCQIYNEYGQLSVNLDKPTVGTILPVAQNRTFVLEASVDCIGDANTTCGNVTVYAYYNGSKSVVGDGSDGPLVVSALNTVVNDYTYLSGNEASGDALITVNNAGAFNVGDEILIIQMQNGTGSGVAGNYEFRFVSSKLGNVLTLTDGLSNSYGSGTFNAISSSVTQVIRVPQYTDVTVNLGASITAPAWNGFVGGVVVFRASGVVNTTGYIDVSEKGYRGGDCNGCGNNAWGDQGEGYTGLGTGVLSANTCGGGGGYGPSGYGGEPGAGGGHGTSGGIGFSSNGFDALGGLSVGENNLSRIFMGGGAGGGGDNDGLTPFPEYVDGGGVVIVFANQISNARVSAIGETSIYPGGVGGVSGSGAGGSIWLSGHSIDIVDVNALGGPSLAGNPPDIGGAGGDGRVRLDFVTSSGVPTTPLGYNGSFGGLNDFRLISNVTGNSPLYIISDLNPKSCGVLNDSDSCTVSWVVNATGPINTTWDVLVLFVSDKVPVFDSVTGNATINITSNIVPIITLFEPFNSSKVLGNGTVSFKWFIRDDTWTNCSLFLNGILNYSANCSSNVNLTYNVSLDRGLYSWFVNVTDVDNNTASSDVWSFYNILNSSYFVNKSISSVNTNMYLVKVLVSNLLPFSAAPVVIDFVDNSFLAGSFTPNYDWLNLSLGSVYNGSLYGWNWVINGGGINESNYSVSGLGDYSLGDEFVVGLE